MQRKPLLITVMAGLLILLAFAPAGWSAVTTPQKGVTIGDWLTPDQAYHIQSTRYAKSDFEDIKSLGCDHVRVLVNFNTYDCVAPDYPVDPILFTVLDQAVQWASDVGLKLIIANDSEYSPVADPDFPKKIWKQIAAHFAGAGDFLLYEVYSQPNTSPAELNPVLTGVIEEIASVDTKHAVIVTASDFGNPNNLQDLPNFSGLDVIYSFHMYEPLLFTYQGGTLPIGGDIVTTGIPFPYDAAKMPALDPTDQANATLAAWYAEYPSTGTVASIQTGIENVVNSNTSKNGPLMCSAFGALRDNIPVADRVAYLSAVRAALESKGIGWTLGGFRGGNGIYEEDGWDMFIYDVSDSVVNAIGLTPPQKQEVNVPVLTEGFTIYDDAPGEGIRVGWWLGDIGEPNFWVADDPKDGAYCLGLWYPGQWNAIDFYWNPVRDMLDLATGDFILDFWIRCDDPTADVDVRFEDSNLDFDERPWRMNKNISDGTVPFDGTWQRVQIPLSDFDDMGAWDPDDETWYGGGEGLYDWSETQRFQLVSETHVQQESELYFDNIRVVHPSAVHDQARPVPAFTLSPNYPNPFNPETAILYTLPSAGRVELAVYNVRGERVTTLVNRPESAGTKKVVWNGTDDRGTNVPSGVYVYTLKANGRTESRRMVLMR